MATLMYRLAINPEQQEKLREEVLRLLPRKDSPINNDNFDDFTYFRACLKESMRLQPQLPVNLRAAGRNIVLDGYRIPKNVSAKYCCMQFLDYGCLADYPQFVRSYSRRT